MASKKRNASPTYAETQHDEIGFWSEIKLDILRKYAGAYSKIVKSHNFRTLYVDAFAGSGKHVSRQAGEFVMGSPARALEVEPPFDEYHFVDMDAAKVKSLEAIAEDRSNVTVHHGDCNKVLLEEVFPRAEYKDYRRAICLLDPYGLQLDWNVMATAARMKSVEIFLNFPIMDINRSVLHPKARENKAQQMTRFWGDDSWRAAAYRTEQRLFDSHEIKVENWELVKAFQERLRTVAGFKYTAEPMAMRNTQRSIVYYLVFAGQNETGVRIVNDIFRDYREKGYG
jgi:three-Cys-motif partner protein